MSILVTGGAGYIGSHVVAALQSDGEEVVVIDDLSTGSQGAVKGIPFARANVGDSDRVHRLLHEHRVEAIIHLAGSIKVEESVADPIPYYRNNVANSLKLIEAAVKEGVKHFIFSSSAAVYGKPDHNPVREDSPTLPINPYGKSKLMVEMALSDIERAHGLRYVSLRYFNAAGAHPGGQLGYKLEKKPSHLLRAVLQAALEEKPFKIFGTDYPTDDGTCVRDYIHVWDLARAHVDALNYLRQKGPSGPFNCGYGKGYSVLQVVEAAKKVAKIDFPVEYAPRRPGDPAALVADVTLIREKFGWKPEFDNLETIISHQLAWERSQREMAE